MKIEDKGIILHQTYIQENMLLLKILSENYGICAGIAKNIRFSKVYDYGVGNLVKFERVARLENQLGVITCHKIRSFQAIIMDSKLNIYMFKNLVNLIFASFIEYEPCTSVFYLLKDFLESLNQVSWLKYCKSEIEILRAAGYGLDFSKCAATGSYDNLAFISPKSGRAVSKEGAQGYENLLLKLPDFLIMNQEPESNIEILESLSLVEYFFKRYVWSKKANTALGEEERIILKNILSSA